jgi:hypothetical protein
VDGVLVAAFVSPAPLLRRGGHSQPWDAGSRGETAFFARLRAAVGEDPQLEALVESASPLTRYAAFVGDAAGRFRESPALREWRTDAHLAFEREEHRLRDDHPDDWQGGESLLRSIQRTAAHLVAA